MASPSPHEIVAQAAAQGEAALDALVASTDGGPVAHALVEAAAVDPKIAMAVAKALSMTERVRVLPRPQSFPERGADPSTTTSMSAGG
jgi:hypothetical protein